MGKNKKNHKGALMLQASDLPPAVRVFWDTAPEAFRIPALLASITC